MGYVLVDAEALEKARNNYNEDVQRFAPSDECLSALRAMHEALAPVVPELPEGCVVMQATPFRVAVRDERRVVHSCMSGGIHNSHAGTGVQTPTDVATYLLARFQAMQGGDND